MIQTYQGYFEDDGRFISDNVVVNIPTMQKVILNILPDEPIPKKKITPQQQLEAIERFTKAMREIDDEPFDDEFDAIMNQGFTIGRNRELDL